jgi:murein L,D-transpeptidase YafK
MTRLARRLAISVLAAAAILGGASAVADEVLSSVATVPSLTTAPLREAGLPMADRLVVRKHERRLLLMRGDRVLRSYKVALGLQPEGHKERVGDNRTPEGKYRLERFNSRSDYFLSIQISYPSPDDVQRAKRHGVDPGGAIMIHGLPNNPSRSLDYYSRFDWTEGCIAVSNSDMVEIWLMTSPDLPIEILP